MSNEVKKDESKTLYSPRVKVGELNDKVVLVVTAPGVKAEDVDLTIEKGRLHIKADATYTAPADYKQVHREFDPARYERSFELSNEIDQDNIEARVENGVITIELAKKKESLKKIEIKAS